jgi:sulfopropanediol 3-dehydrogenase
VRRYLKKAAPRDRGDTAALESAVREMLAEIKQNRDDAVRRYAEKLDHWTKPEFRVSADEIRLACARLPETFKEDFKYAYDQVTGFARHQRDSMKDFEVEIEPGIWLGQKLIPVANVGCYIPGGKYPLISAAIMSIGTARAAGVDHVIACAPPRDSQGIYPPQLYALHTAGADEIYVLGGVQALAAMAFGCVGMRAVDMITGPGNPYVAEAKRQLFGQVGIDLLGQAEHGPDSPVWLITTSEQLGNLVIRDVERQLTTLPTAALAGAAWNNNGEVVIVDSDDEAIAVSDEYAPEHLELMTQRNDYYQERLKNYGSLFVGEESTVAYGDKGVGTNHTLPTGKAARYTGGLWAGKFIKTVTYQRLTPQASRRIAPAMGRLCHMEGMLAHEITADARFSRYPSGNAE